MGMVFYNITVDPSITQVTQGRNCKLSGCSLLEEMHGAAKAKLHPRNELLTDDAAILSLKAKYLQGVYAFLLQMRGQQRYVSTLNLQLDTNEEHYKINYTFFAFPVIVF